MHQLGITGAEQDEYTIGMVTDMMTESENDQIKYPRRATQTDIDKFIGG